MCAGNVNKKHSKIAFLTIPVMLLIATVAISFVITEDAFAMERYAGDSTSQAAAVSNECLNPIFDSNNIDNVVGVGNCGSTVTQQDESGQAGATTTHQTTNPTIELQRSTSTAQQPLTGDTCEECFDSLTAAQISEFENRLPENFGSSVTTIEQLCDFLASEPEETVPAAIEDAGDILEGLPSPIPPPSLRIILDIENCLSVIFG
jgi:hypothetical protein